MTIQKAETLAWQGRSVVEREDDASLLLADKMVSMITQKEQSEFENCDK